MRLTLLVLSFLFTGCLLESRDEGEADPGTEADADTDADADADADRDDDGDGLTNSEEADLGTDAAAADSDGDGFDDGAEVADGTNPAWEWSHTYDQGDYLIGTCPTPPDVAAAGPTGEGSYDTYTWDAYQEGDILDNFVAKDRFDQEVTPYAFCGNYTLVTMGAEWCGPCQSLASAMADETEEIRAVYPNFTFYEFLYQDNYGAEPDEDVLRDWVRAFDLQGIPVVAPRDNTAAWVNYLNATGGIPATILLAPDMTVIWSGVNHPSEYYLYDADGVMSAIADYEAR
ncbi:MAG: thioredoxin family protein [Pseudomonadota bacterium]|nr:thioredoxin family protein [Pseudomonadota bacterium]